jgi:hypothetical protein
VSAGVCERMRGRVNMCVHMCVCVSAGVCVCERMRGRVNMRVHMCVCVWCVCVCERRCV